MARDAEHPFICLWALCMFSLEKCVKDVISFFLLAPGLLVVPVLVDGGLDCLFEMFLSFLGRPVSL